MTLEEWVTAVCAELAVSEPDVAHAVGRPAAPLTSLIVGLAAHSAADLPEVIARVRGLLPEPTEA
jgi:hypothetical protein